MDRKCQIGCKRGRGCLAADAAGGKAGYSLVVGGRDDDRSADGQRRLETVTFPGCASSILGRHQRRRRKFGEVDVGSKLSEATKPTGRTAR